jgi:hypothetical protein
LKEEKESLERDYYALLDQQAALQKDVDNLLEQHGRLMQSARAPAPASNWFEAAHLVLNQMAVNPDLRTTQVFAGALATLQTKLAAIVSRIP